MFADEHAAPIPPVSLTDCKVTHVHPYRGPALRHLGATGHEREYLGCRESRTFEGFGVSLLDVGRTPLPLYRGKDGALWVGIEDGRFFLAELHVAGAHLRGDRWAAALRVNETQACPPPSTPGGSFDVPFYIVTQPRRAGDNIMSGLIQPSGEVEPFVACSEERQLPSRTELARFGTVSCTFYSEWHPQRFVSPQLRGPVVRGYVVGSNGEVVADAPRETFNVSRDFNTKIEIRFAPQSEIARLGLAPVEPPMSPPQSTSDWQGLSMPQRPDRS
jgi:hypothetical protein